MVLACGCATGNADHNLDSVAAVEAAIKGGALGAEAAERATKTGNLYLTELLDTGIPYSLYTYSDYQAGYTVMVEGDRLVLLCAGFGGGYARDLAIHREWEGLVLTYHFHVGSGVSYTMAGRYVLGSGQASWEKWGQVKP